MSELNTKTSSSSTSSPKDLQVEPTHVTHPSFKKEADSNRAHERVLTDLSPSADCPAARINNRVGSTRIAIKFIEVFGSPLLGSELVGLQILL